MEDKELLKKEALRRRLAAERAELRARVARWDIDIAVYLFAVLAMLIILVSQDVRLEIVAPIAVVALALCWFVGWRRGKTLYEIFYQEELSKRQEDLE